MACLSRVRRRSCLAFGLRLLLVVTPVIVLGACGGTGSPPTERVLTNDEASRLASTLYLNHVLGTAWFELHTLTEIDGSEVALEGVVNWGAGTGRAFVTVDSQVASLTEVAWWPKIVAERRPNLDLILSGRGVSHPIFLARAADFNRRVDSIIRVIASLAVAQPENSLLIRQREGSSYLRNDEVRGRRVDVMRFGYRSVYWVDRETGALLRFEGNDATGQMPIVIDLFSDGEIDVQLPSPMNMVDVAQIPGIAANLTDF